MPYRPGSWFGDPWVIESPKGMIFMRGSTSASRPIGTDTAPQPGMAPATSAAATNKRDATVRERAKRNGTVRERANRDVTAGARRDSRTNGRTSGRGILAPADSRTSVIRDAAAREPQPRHQRTHVPAGALIQGVHVGVVELFEFRAAAPGLGDPFLGERPATDFVED